MHSASTTTVQANLVGMSANTSAALKVDMYDLFDQHAIPYLKPSVDDAIVDGQTSLLAAKNPTYGEIIAWLHCANNQDYEDTVNTASNAFKQWRTVPAPRRAALIRDFASMLRQHKAHLAALISIESGKLRSEGEGEIQEMIDIADFAVGLSRQLYGKTMHSERPQHRMYEQWHPLGPVGIITSFNFPAAIWAWNAFIAIICGNSVIWKPSPKASLTALAIHSIARYLEKRHQLHGVFNLLIAEGPTLGQKLAADPRLPLISFTGSSHTGRHVAQTVAARLGRSVLECGGNNAVIVDQSADLDLALRAILFGAVGTAGQRCTTTRRLFVHSSCYDEMVARLLEAYQQVRIGDPLRSSTLMGPLIDAAAQEKFANAVHRAIGEGGTVLYGGRIIEGQGYFVEPTLIAAQNHWAIVQEETFAPILYIMRYENFADVLQQHNAVTHGLSSSLFTRDLQHAEQFMAVTGSDCGIANINLGTSGAEIGGAFGGEKDSGGGREAGSDAWKNYMRRQTNTINWGNDLPLAQGVQFDLTAPQSRRN